MAAAKLEDLPSSRWLVPLQKDLEPPMRFLRVCCCRPAVRGFQVELLIQLPGRWFCLSRDSLKTSQKLRRKKAEIGGEWWRKEVEKMLLVPLWWQYALFVDCCILALELLVASSNLSV